MFWSKQKCDDAKSVISCLNPPLNLNRTSTRAEDERVNLLPSPSCIFYHLYEYEWSSCDPHEYQANTFYSSSSSSLITTAGDGLMPRCCLLFAVFVSYVLYSSLQCPVFISYVPSLSIMSFCLLLRPVFLSYVLSSASYLCSLLSSVCPLRPVLVSMLDMSLNTRH